MGQDLMLAQTFHSHCRGTLQAEPLAQEETLRDLLARGRDRWGKIVLPPNDFMAHLAQRAPVQDGAVPLAELCKLHVSDLYLACACQRNVPGALEEFEQYFLLPLSTYLRRSEPSQSVIDEVCQTLREQLFIAGPAPTAHSTPTLRSPKIASYDGRGALQSWLRVVATRTLLTKRRGERRQREQPFDDSDVALFPIHENPDLRILKQQHEADIKQAITEALAALPPERQTVLRLHLVDGLTLEKIAGLYRVNRSSVKRWIDDARARLLSDLRRRLQSRLGIPQTDVDSLVTLLRSQLDLSISRIFKVVAP